MSVLEHQGSLKKEAFPKTLSALEKLLSPPSSPRRKAIISKLQDHDTLAASTSLSDYPRLKSAGASLFLQPPSRTAANTTSTPPQPHDPYQAFVLTLPKAPLTPFSRDDAPRLHGDEDYYKGGECIALRPSSIAKMMDERDLNHADDALMLSHLLFMASDLVYVSIDDFTALDEIFEDRSTTIDQNQAYIKTPSILALMHCPVCCRINPKISVSTSRQPVKVLTAFAYQFLTVKFEGNELKWKVVPRIICLECVDSLSSSATCTEKFKSMFDCATVSDYYKQRMQAKCECENCQLQVKLASVVMDSSCSALSSSNPGTESNTDASPSCHPRRDYIDLAHQFALDWLLGKADALQFAVLEQIVLGNEFPGCAILPPSYRIESTEDKTAVCKIDASSRKRYVRDGKY